MSIQMSSYLKSVLTNMIFYERQRKPCRRPQSTGLNHHAGANRNVTMNPNFCNKFSKSLKSALQPHISLLQQRSVQQQFAACLQKWAAENAPSNMLAANNLPHIHGFDFNEDSSISERWKIKFKVEPVTEHLLELHIPAFVPWDSITAPINTTQIVCSVTAASCKIANPMEQGCSYHSFIIPYDNAPLPARMIPLSIPASDGYLCITTVGLQYELKNGKTYTRPAYTPCSVIDARYR